MNLGPLSRRKGFVWKLFLVLTLVALIFLIQLWYYLLSEFVFRTHRDGQCSECIGKRVTNATIPRYIHQVFFFITESELPPRYLENQRTWLEQNQGYTYILWNATMIDQLIHDRYPEVEELYNSYGHWIRRSDVARYLVLHQFGGIYADMDLKCLKPVAHLLNKIGDKGIVMYETTPFGVTNDFLVTEARHPFFAYVIQGLKNSNRWYVFPHAQTMLSTGPTYLTGRYYNFDLIDDIRIFTRKDMQEYFNHTSGFSWHNWDSATIKWYNDHWSVTVPITKFALLLLIICICIMFLKKIGERVFNNEIINPTYKFQHYIYVFNEKKNSRLD